MPGSSTPSVVPTQGSLYIRTDGSSTSTRMPLSFAAYRAASWCSRAWAPIRIAWLAQSV